MTIDLFIMRNWNEISSRKSSDLELSYALTERLYAVLEKNKSKYPLLHNLLSDPYADNKFSYKETTRMVQEIADLVKMENIVKDALKELNALAEKLKSMKPNTYLFAVGD